MPARRQFQPDSERELHVRVRIAVPPEGCGRQFAIMRAWLDAVCGPANWASAPSGFGGVVNDAIAFYFADAALAAAFVNRFCCGYRSAEAAGTTGSGRR